MVSSMIASAVTWTDRIAGFLLGAITLLIFAAALMRYLFAIPIPDAFDLSRLLLGCALFWGLASVCFDDAHIRIDLLADRLSPRGRWLLEIFSNLVTFLAIAVFCWMLLHKVLETVTTGEETFDLGISIWPFYGVAWLGVAAATCSSLARVFLLLANVSPRLRNGE